MDVFLRNAEQILETAARAKECVTPEYLICVSRGGSIQMLSETTGWSLPALAMEYGASAVYRVKRLGGMVRVEGWSAGRQCSLSRDQSAAWWSRPRAASFYATLHPVELTGGSVNDLVPQVWNS